MSPITVILAGPPQGKERARVRGKTAAERAEDTLCDLTGARRPKRRLGRTPTKTRVYEEALRWAARRAMGSRPPIEGPVKVEVLAVFAVPVSWSARDRAAALAGALRPQVKPDFDNIGKVVDAFKGVVWKDDCAVVDGRVQKFYGTEPRLEVHIWPLSGDAT